MNKHLYFLFLAGMIFFSNYSFAQVTLNLHPNAISGKDATIVSSIPSSNYGTDPDFAAITWTGGGGFTERGLIGFDLSSVPQNATITSATLSLYCNTASSNTQLSSGANACLLQRITSTWSESTVTWNNQPTTTTVHQDTLAQSDSTKQNYPAIDVKNLVVDMINNPSTSFGFMLKLQTEATYRSLVMSSSDHSDSTKWPRLEIVYTPGNVYYSKSSGSLDSLGTWGINTDGTGTVPPNFSQNNTTYIVQNSSAPTMVSNWIVIGTNTTVIFGDGTNTLNASVPSGLICGADSLYVRNNVTLTVLGSLVTNKPGFENGSTVQYAATGTQTIIPSSFYNLVVSGGTKTLSANTTVRNTLAMLTNINCGANTLTLGTSTTQIGILTYGSGSVIGNFSRWFAGATNSGTTGLFPTGTSSKYNPIQVEYTSAPSTGGTLTAVFTPTNPGSNGLSPAITDFTTSPIVSVNKAAPNGYWTLTPANGMSGGIYTAIAAATGFSGISNIAGLRLLRRTNAASAWALPGSFSAPSGTTASPVVPRTGYTSNGGDFGIGADSTVNSLPVTFLNFTANYFDEKNILLNWETAQEMNNDYFEVEKSIGNRQWSVIGKVDGNGTTNSKSNYQFTDHNISGQTANIFYYRLKQMDFDGNMNYSNTISVNLSAKSMNEFYLFPNPVKSLLNIHTPNNVNFTIINLLGQQVYNGNETQIDLSNWKKGVYFIKTDEEGVKTVKKFVVE